MYSLGHRRSRYCKTLNIDLNIDLNMDIAAQNYSSHNTILLKPGTDLLQFRFQTVNPKP